MKMPTNRLNQLKICSNCVLPETFPGIHFNEERVCNYCLNFSGMEILKKEKKRYRHKFEYLLARYRKNKGYDFLVCYSGGKDSTYILDIFKNHYNLRILAITMDNGFISPVALENIRRVVETIGVDHLFFKPKFELLKRIFSRAAIEVFYSRKSLERASTICTSCIGIVKFVALRIAIEQEIPFIGYGWSPGQAPLQSSVMRTNPILIRATQKTLQEPLVQRFGDEVNAYFLEERHFTEPDRFPYNIHPLAFLEYNEEKIYKRVAELGWKKPKDTDPNSTNCLLNAYANYVHQQQFGYNPYVFEIAKMVREGIMSREEGLLRVSGSPQIEQINLIEERLKL